MWLSFEQICDTYNFDKNEETYIIYKNEIENIFNNQNFEIYLYNDILLSWIGNYYHYVLKNYDKAKEYYLMAIEKGHSNAMLMLALKYDIDEKYDDAQKYYLMAIEKGHSDAMYMLALTNCFKKNYDEAKKYYLMAIEKGHSDAMYKLALYYNDIEKNYDEAKEYYLMAI
jgi:TPR repeat protein